MNLKCKNVIYFLTKTKTQSESEFFQTSQLLFGKTTLTVAPTHLTELNLLKR